LLLVGINAITVTNTFLPDSSGTPHVGTIDVDGKVVNYDGVFPVSILGGTIANLIINVPTATATTRPSSRTTAAPSTTPAGAQRQRTFETTQFTNPTTSLTVITGNDGETVTFAHLDPAFDPTGAPRSPAARLDTFRVDFSSTVDVIPPTGGITFNGGANNDAIVFVAGYPATNVTHNYTDNHSGSIVVDGRTLTYTGLSQARGIFDPLAASVGRSTSRPPTTTSRWATTQHNNGLSRISSTASSPTTDFANPTTSVTVNLGLGADTIGAGPLDATGPPATVNLNGFDGTDIAADGATRSTSAQRGHDLQRRWRPADHAAGRHAERQPDRHHQPVPDRHQRRGNSKTGNYTFTNRMPVNFTEIETLTPSTVDLSIDKTDHQTSAVPGTTITYTITVTNNGTIGVTA